MITHYQRLLDYIEPDFVHVLSDGKIIKTGDKSLALELEERGYDWVVEEIAWNSMPKPLRLLTGMLKTAG